MQKLPTLTALLAACCLVFSCKNAANKAAQLEKTAQHFYAKWQFDSAAQYYQRAADLLLPLAENDPLDSATQHHYLQLRLTELYASVKTGSPQALPKLDSVAQWVADRFGRQSPEIVTVLCKKAQFLAARAKPKEVVSVADSVFIMAKLLGERTPKVPLADVFGELARIKQRQGFAAAALVLADSSAHLLRAANGGKPSGDSGEAWRQCGDVARWLPNKAAETFAYYSRRRVVLNTAA